MTINDVLPLVSAEELLSDGDIYSKKNLQKMDFEEAAFAQYENDGTLVFKYDDFRDAPTKHKVLLNLKVYGRSDEQIATMWRCPVRRIRETLRHPPLAAEFEVMMFRARAAAEKRMQEIREAAKEGFDVTRKTVNNEEVDVKVRLDGAKTLMALDPDGLYSKKKKRTEGRTPMDSNALEEFFSRMHRSRKQVEPDSVEDVAYANDCQ